MVLYAQFVMKMCGGFSMECVEMVNIERDIEKSIENFRGEVQDLVNLYYSEVKQIPILENEEEQELIKRKALGDEQAKKRLIEANLRLVLWVIARYYHGVTSMEFLDLVQEGNLGLIKGIDKMDPSKNCKIATYVPYYIRSQISYALAGNESKLSHSYSMGVWIRKVKKVEREYQTQYGRLPTQDELATELNLSLNKVKEVYRTIAPMIELNDCPSVLEEASREELIGDPHTLSPEEIYIQRVEHETLYGLLEHFSERDKELISLFLGLYDGTCHTERELAERFQITKARVGQIKDKLKRYQNDSEIQSIFEERTKANSTQKGYQKKR